MRSSPTRLRPHSARELLDVAVNEGAACYPGTVDMERTDAAHAGQIETIQARYVVGYDGARSAVRKSMGQQLIDFDREWAKIISDKPKQEGAEVAGVDPKAFQQYFEQHGRFTAGMGTHYASCALCGLISTLRMNCRWRRTRRWPSFLRDSCCPSYGATKAFLRQASCAAQQSRAVGALPGELGLFAAEVAVGGGLFVDGAQQV